MPELVVKTKKLKYRTKERLEFKTITKDVEDFIKESKVWTGSVIIQTNHTTCGVWVNENEKNLIGPSSEIGYVNDLKKVIDCFANPDAEYHHNDVKDRNNPCGRRDTHLCDVNSCGEIPECRNGHAHAQAMIIKNSISMIVENGCLAKGRWQEILLVELDYDRDREVNLLVQGIMK
jgi:thiamine phosphate synthase YjbQ (UPF0047 family)